jgi:hypothetical protein
VGSNTFNYDGGQGEPRYQLSQPRAQADVSTALAEAEAALADAVNDEAVRSAERLFVVRKENGGRGKICLTGKGLSSFLLHSGQYG